MFYQLVLLCFVLFNPYYQLNAQYGIQTALPDDNSILIGKQYANVLDEMPIADFNELSQYNLSLKLNEVTATLDGNISVNYHNKNAISHSSLYFHLYLAGMSYNSIPGRIQILKVANLLPPYTNLTYTIDSAQQLLQVDFPIAISPHNNSLFEIHFHSILPDGNDRTHIYGWDQNQTRIFTCTSFYPMLAMFDLYDGWNLDQYLTIGDPFYADMAFYDVKLEVPLGMKVACTGQMLNSTSNESTIIYHFNPQLPVREIAFSTSRYFLCNSQIIPSMNVNVTSFFLPVSQSLWSCFAISTAVQALIFFNNTFGHYPYPTFNVVESAGWYGGMEYPCLIHITATIETSTYLEMVIAHETAHQWWYQLVGVDEIDWGFIDEGLAVWSTDLYLYQNEFSNTTFALDDYFSSVESTEYQVKINQSIYDAGSSYWYAAYTKTPVIFEKLRATIGVEAFLTSLQTFLAEYSYAIATLNDLQKCFENQVNSSLDWFFKPWFNNGYLPFYNLDLASYSESRNLLSLTISDVMAQTNDFPYSQAIPVRIYDLSDNVLISTIVQITNASTTFDFSVSITPKTIMIFLNGSVLAHRHPLFGQVLAIDVLTATESSVLPQTTIGFTILSLFVIIFLYKNKTYKK